MLPECVTAMSCPAKMQIHSPGPQDIVLSSSQSRNYPPQLRCASGSLGVAGGS
ncbi:hypothetical protein HPP92_029017 [Vanilla planifolia]|uniref:Uncharacterized protein n=1 Tax=Vanilla planifolia TaxID=51239 RepID=A0A835P581_VANPL|nr:hypothetical protein HPP92_029005 [Vanilla planifolia]KAG0446085.1 hypothetical protein HPP92_029017 [Vanilla planifolia]